MDVREKLVELQLKADLEDEVSENTTQHREYIADLMIAHGVTVQTPQMPVKHIVCAEGIRIGNGIWGKGTTVYKCPQCGAFVSKLYDYCSKCGQAFCWDGSHVSESKGVEIDPFNKWISVKDRLPDTDGDYLVWNDFHKAIVGHYWANGRYFISKAVAVTHWMPLPQPPKGE